MLMHRIHSYVVRYDSGFAPNPFYGFCTLATCKADIRQAAKVGDWVVGSGSADRKVGRGGHLVYAMEVTEAITFEQFDSDPRFQPKKPYRVGSRKQSCGDNIYFRDPKNSEWLQRDSFHTNDDGTIHRKHVEIDTSVNRVLISDKFVYFGGDGPRFPEALTDNRGRPFFKTGIGRVCFEDQDSIERFKAWVKSLDVLGFQSPPFEWMTLRG